LITNAKMSCAPFDTKGQRLLLKIYILPRLVPHIIGFFSTNLNNIPYENYFLKGKATLRHKSILKHFNYKLKAIDF
jgi:hypothetical protein